MSITRCIIVGAMAGLSFTEFKLSPQGTDTGPDHYESNMMSIPDPPPSMQTSWFNDFSKREFIHVK